MIVGIPGTGIGGLFYLLSALWLPVRALARRVRGRTARLPSTLRQALLALGILGGLWLTGELLGMLVARALPLATTGAPGSVARGPGTGNWFRMASLLLGGATLAAVLITVRVARVVVRRTATVPLGDHQER